MTTIHTQHAAAARGGRATRAARVLVFNVMFLGLCLAGAACKTGGGETALHKAAITGHAADIDSALANGANIDQTDGGETALYKAAKAGNAETVEALLKHGANMNIANSDQESPLYAAAEDGHKRVVELLLANGAN